MIRAVVWKEFREQWLIALTLLVLGGGVLVGAATLGDPPIPGAAPTDVIKSLGVGRLATLMLIVTAGMVCGGALFAAEREAGTMTFLEVLPAARGALWRSKFAAGLALALAQTGALLVLAAALGLADRSFAGRLVVYGLLAFAWGALGSTLARTTLGSVGVAIPAAVLAMFVYLLPICLVFAPRGSNFPRPIGWAVFEALMLVTPLGASAWWFTAPDRARAAGPGRTTSSVRVLVWLGLRQLRVTGPVLSAFALAFGLGLLVPENRPMFVWPALALAAGVLAGVTVFGDEQAHRIAPFWAEGRLPIGRVWGVKIGLHLALVAWLLFLLLLPSAVRAQFEAQAWYSHGRSTFAAIFHERLFDELNGQTWKYLLIPAGYGFAAGHLCGLLFRKLVVACGVALIVGGSLAALWGPSLLAGGLHHWQVWLPAAVLLLTGRGVIRSWASDRVIRRGPLLRLASGTGAALLAMLFGLGYRVLEVPELPGADDDIEFVNSLPSYDVNIGGREFRIASERYARTASAIERQPEGRAAARLRPRLDERLEFTFRQGWPPADAEFTWWLDRMFSGEQLIPEEQPWTAIVAGAATRPIGIFEPPQLVGTATATAAGLDNARRMAAALLARGLQRQADGDPAAFPEAFRTVLILAQTLRNGGGVLPLGAGIEVERQALLAADRWLERYTGSADLLRTVVRTTEQRDASGTLDPLPHYLSDRYVLRELMRAPGPWLAVHLSPPGSTGDQATPEADLVAFAWTVPWERERTRRLLGLGFEQGINGPTPARMAFIVGRPGAGALLTRNHTVADLIETDRYLCVQRRALVLKFALRAYLVDRKVAPAALADLVAGAYLAAVPEDPYLAGSQFNYRVSTGENLRGVARVAPGRVGDEIVPVPIQPGQILLWSVGIDHKDQGGKVAPGGARAEDLVFLVPMFPPAPK